MTASNDNIYVTQRREKISALRQKGIPPYPNTYKPAHLSTQLLQRFEKHEASQLDALQERFSLGGRVVFNRPFGKAGFMKIRDRKGEIQVFCQKNTLNENDFSLYRDCDVGDVVYVEGPLFRTKTGELTVKAKRLVLLAKGIQPLPEKWHGLTDVEARYRSRYVDLIANQNVKEIFLKRSQIIQHIRKFLTDRDFLEVETPMMQPIPGGALAKPFITHHHALDMDLYLRIAPELYLKRLIVGGFERVFEINRNFRNEGISIQHNPEFTMLEFYQSYATYDDLMLLTEEMLSSAAQALYGTLDVPYQSEPISWKPPFLKMTLAEALVKIAGLDAGKIQDEAYLKGVILKKGFPQMKGGLGALQTALFEHLVEKKLIQPTFITQFPTEVSPLARRNDHNPEVTDRFELYVYGREIANAFSELNDPADQKERFLKQVVAKEDGNEEAMYFDADYISALEYGMPPTAGEGIGIDRLVMLLTDSQSIRDVILFPHMRPAS